MAILDPVHLLLVLEVHDGKLLLEVLHQGLVLVLCLLGDLLVGELVNLDLLLLVSFLKFLFLSLIKLIQFGVLLSQLSQFPHILHQRVNF